MMHAGIKNGEMPAGAVLQQDLVFALDHFEPADAAADIDADHLGIASGAPSGRRPSARNPPAAMANWMKRPIFLISFFSM